MKKCHPYCSFALITCFLFCCSRGNGQGTSSDLSQLVVSKQSMKSENIHCGLQDRFGNLWFGTTGDGVFRYDGKSFKQYTRKEGLNSNRVWSIMEDNKGNIWMGTDDGVCRFDGKTFSRISMTNQLGFNYSFSNKKNDVWSICQDRKGIIWFGTYDNLYRYDGKNFSRFLDDRAINNKSRVALTGVNCIYEDKNGILWFGSGMLPGSEGVCSFDGKDLNCSKPNGDGWIRYIIADKNNRIWFGGRSKGNFYFEEKKFIPFTQKTGIGNSILCDSKGNIWFTGAESNTDYENKEGIWRYDGKDFKNFSAKEGMGNYFVHCMVEDRDGNIWIGTRNTGLYKYDGKKFTCYSKHEN